VHLPLFDLNELWDVMKMYYAAKSGEKILGETVGYRIIRTVFDE